MPSAYELAFLRRQVQLKLQFDPFFQVADIDDALNDAQDDLAIWTRQNIDLAGFLTVNGQAEYAWPVDALMIVGINVNGLELDEMTYEEYRRSGGLANTLTLGDPGKYYIRGRNFGLFPTPQQQLTGTVVCVQKVPNMTNDTDPPYFPRSFIEPMVYHACWKLTENDAQRKDESVYFKRMYDDTRGEKGAVIVNSQKRKVRNTVRRA